MISRTLSKYATVLLYSNCDVELVSLIRPYVGIPMGQECWPTCRRFKHVTLNWCCCATETTNLLEIWNEQQ